MGCNIVDTLDIMWGADNDGDPINGEFIDDVVFDCYHGWTKSAPDAHGFLFLDYPWATASQPVNVSYNWWSGYWMQYHYEWGPRRRENYRDFLTGGTGWPDGDRNAYYVMSSGEIDYDMIYTASISGEDPIWLTPPLAMAEWCTLRGLPAPPCLLSAGPFDISPGASVSIPLAFVGGEDFHVYPNNREEYLPLFPDHYYENLDFTDLFRNATFAKWVYDNPGVDTDGDEYAGDFILCNGDTVYTSGDGVPDWRGAVPPPAPAFWLEPLVNGIKIRFNGTMTETARDLFSNEIDFEGYHIYIGLDERASSMALVASYDKEDYDKFIWNGRTDSALDFSIFDPPFSMDSLRCIYGSGEDPCQDTLFDPLSFTASSFYTHPQFPDSIFYFLPHDFNTFELGVTTPIYKVYPDQPHPGIYHPDSIPAEAYTSDGFLKYYEYEFVIEDLMSTVPYYVNVTAFDFGQPDLGFKGFETAVTSGIKNAYPLAVSNAAGGGNSKVYVYPNPYRGDADYRAQGFEGRTQDDRPDYRVRAIHFGNLPPKCTIYIYSLDGDLVRELEHDTDPSDPNCGHDSWNLITRNTQLAVSGLYYWVVESEDGSTQMGKLVIIM